MPERSTRVAFPSGSWQSQRVRRLAVDLWSRLAFARRRPQRSCIRRRTPGGPAWVSDASGSKGNTIGRCKIVRAALVDGMRAAPGDQVDAVCVWLGNDGQFLHSLPRVWRIFDAGVMGPRAVDRFRQGSGGCRALFLVPSPEQPFGSSWTVGRRRLPRPRRRE